MKARAVYTVNEVFVECDCGESHYMRENEFYITCTNCERDIEFNFEEEIIDVLEYKEEL